MTRPTETVALVCALPASFETVNFGVKMPARLYMCVKLPETWTCVAPPFANAAICSAAELPSSPHVTE